MDICPAGLFCFDKNTIVLLIISIIIVIVYFINNNNDKFNMINNDLQSSKVKLESKLYKYKKQLNNSNAVQTIRDDTNYANNVDMQRISNPLYPPERSFPYRLNRGGVPINIPTRGYSSGYQQVGVLIEEHAAGTDNKRILPLYGEQTYSGSNQWKYYTGTDGFQSVKLPVIHNNRNCQDENGCNEIYDNNQVNILAYNTPYKASIYKLDAPRYIPNVL
jgi:hypothetical protein